MFNIVAGICVIMLSHFNENIQTLSLTVSADAMNICPLQQGINLGEARAMAPPPMYVASVYCSDVGFVL